MGRTLEEVGGCSCWGRWAEICSEGRRQQEAGILQSTGSIGKEEVGKSRDQSASDTNDRKNPPQAEEAGHSLLQLRKPLSWPKLGCEARISLRFLL